MNVLLSLPLTNDCIVFHAVPSVSLVLSRGARDKRSLAHAKHAVNLLYAKPVQDIGHESLEAHILDSGNVLGSLEVIRSSVLTTFPGIVDNYATLAMITTAQGTLVHTVL